MSELKPCPFCGGEAEAVHEINGFWTVECVKCGALVDGIDAWNTRAERTCRRVDVNGYGFRFECSACGYVAIVHNCEIRLDELPNYCPNCGAKVVGE